MSNRDDPDASDWPDDPFADDPTLSDQDRFVLAEFGIGTADAEGYMTDTGHGHGGIIRRGPNEQEIGWRVEDLAQRLPKAWAAHVEPATRTVLAFFDTLYATPSLPTPDELFFMLGSALAQHLAGAESDRPARDLGAAFRPADLLATERVVTVVERHARNLRRELFESGKAPFQRWIEAQQWIEEEAKLPFDPTPWQEAHRRLEEMIVSAVQELRGRASPYWYEVPTINRVPYVHYPRDDGWACSVQALPSDGLRRLAWTQDRISAAFDWEPWQATLFLLVGAPPLTPAYRVKYHRGGVARLSLDEEFTRRPDWVQLDILGRSFSYEDIREVFRHLRAVGFLRAGRPAPYLDKLPRLWSFVNERRPAPDDYRVVAQRQIGRDGRVRRFRPTPWNLVLRQWNDTYPSDKYKSDRGLRKAYRAACAHMEQGAVAKTEGGGHAEI